MVKFPVLGWITAGAVALALVAGWVAKAQYDRALLAETALAELHVAVASKDEVIDAFIEAYKAAAKLAAEDKARQAASAKTIESLTATIEKQRRALKAQEDADRGLPECQALLAVDLATMCPGHARGVRERAEGGLQGPNR